jgi:hypothetical protein
MPDAITTAVTTASPDAAACGDGAARPLAERQIEALGELVDIGLKIARAIERQVDAAAAEPTSAADLNAAAIAYARAARAVRQAVMLQGRLRADRDAWKAKAGSLRSRLTWIVRRAVEDEHDDAERVERLVAEAAERLEQERYGDVLTRPVEAVLAGICKDLGLDPDWTALAGDVAAAEAFARGHAGDAMVASPAEPERFEIRWLDAEEPPAPVRDSS